jgi:hypothetical protein
MQSDQSKTEGAASPRVQPLVLQPRHKWFSSYDNLCDDGWWGPHDTVEAAALECYCKNSSERIFVAQGRKLTKAELEDLGVEYTWEVEVQHAFEIKMFELLDTMKRLYAERWPNLAAPYREMIAGAMEGSGDKNPLSAVIPLAESMSARGYNPTLLMAVAVEMADS